MGLADFLDLLMFATVFAVLLSGFPVAFALGGTALLFALLAYLLGVFDLGFLQALPQRIYGIMRNEVLIAIPLFIYMGMMLERSKVAEELLGTAGRVLARVPGGLGYAVTVVGALLAASTGMVGATAVTMGLISLPVMLRAGYDARLATGSIAASATLAQIVPPSTVLVVLGDQMSIAYQQAQLAEGIFAPETVTVGDLFAGALLPGLMLAGLYLLYQVSVAVLHPERSPPLAARETVAPVTAAEFVRALVAPVALIVAVLGSILGGIATPTEAAAVGAVGATLLAFLRVLVRSGAGELFPVLRGSLEASVQLTAMIFLILIGATIFSLVFRGLGGDETIHGFLSALPGGSFTAVALVMAAMFVLGFFLDFLEIVFVVVPVVAPVLLRMEGVDPVWLGVLMAVNLQTSFLTPPFGPTLFYLRGVAPDSVTTAALYRGVLPFVAIQIVALLLLWSFPGIATWLPGVLYGGVR